MIGESLFMNDQKFIKEMLALLWIKKYGVLGRYRLRKLLNLTEGVTRGLLKKLSNENLVKAEGRKGFSLTQKGQQNLKKKLRELHIEEIKEIDVGALKTSGESVVIHLRNLEHNVHSGLEQRDAAVKAGADGATTLIFKNGVLSIPFSSEKIKLQNELIQMFKKEFKLRNGDVLIIGFSKDKSKALEGALAASLYTLKNAQPKIDF